MVVLGVEPRPIMQKMKVDMEADPEQQVIVNGAGTASDDQHRLPPS